MLGRIAALLLLVSAGFGAAEAQRERETPYWASISAGRAMMRTGPGRNYPATWLYVRPDLPIRVVEVYDNWRKVEDPDGATGWMLVNLLSSTRTGLVRGEEPLPLRAQPNGEAPIVYRAEPGVVGRIPRCAEGWCLLDVGGRRGYAPADALWGVDPGEKVD